MTPFYRRRNAIALFVVLALFATLGTVYATVVPIFEKPDEINHYFTVQYLMDERALPIQEGSKENLWAQEASQPPLYYILAALAASGIDTSDARELVWLNPQRNLGDPRNPGNKNLIVHTERERWPYSGAVLSVHLARWLSLLFGAGTVFCTYAIAREIFPDRPALALGAAAVNAFVPQFLFISSSVSNDSLIALLSALVLLQLTRMLVRPRPISARQASLLGATLGLAALTKLSGLALLGLSGLVLFWIAWRRGSWREFLRNGLIVVGLVAAVAGWWYVRNVRLYGDPTGLSAMLQVVGQRTDFARNARGLWGEFAGVRASFWGLFGWFNLPLPDAIYSALDGLLVLGLVGLGWWFARRRHRSPGATRALVALLAWAAVVSILLVRWTSMTHGSQGRLLFPAMPGIALGLALGWSAWLPQRWRDGAPLAVGGGLLVLSAVVPCQILAPAYAPTETMAPDALPSDLARINVTFGEMIRLHGCRFDRQRLLPGETLAVTCYWQALEPLDTDYFTYQHLLGREGVPVGKEHGYPDSGRFPTSLWPSGQVVAATEWVPVNTGIVTPTAAHLAVGVYDPATGVHLKPANPQGQPLGLILAGRVKIATPEGQEVKAPNRLRYTVGEMAELAGYEVEPATAAPGETVQVTLYWQALATPSEDYTVFVHLLDAQGTPRGYGDGPPVGGNYPTLLWEPGEVIVDEHTVRVEADAPPGRYRIAVGLYRPDDGARLPVQDETSAPQPEDRVILPFELRIGGE